MLRQASDRVIGTPPRYFMTSASPHISAYPSRSDWRNMRRINRSVSRDSTMDLRTPGYTTDSVWLRFFNISRAVRTLEYAPFAASPTFSRELLHSARVIRALPSATIAPRCCAASDVALRRKVAGGSATSAPQCRLAIIPTLRVKKASPAPLRIELARID